MEISIPETVAAVRAFQITFGLAADGIPGPKTATAVAVALDPVAQQAIIPSVAKAADHVDALAATATPTTAPALANAATDLKATAAATPVPTEVQTHASTAAAQAATAASAAPPGVAEPLADASHALAAATTTPTPDVTQLATATTAISAAANAAVGSTSAPSLVAAGESCGKRRCNSGHCNTGRPPKCSGGAPCQCCYWRSVASFFAGGCERRVRRLS